MNQDEMIDDSLLARYLAGEATPEEAMVVTDWMEKSNHNKQQIEASQKILNLLKEVDYTAPEKAEIWKGLGIGTKTKTRRIQFFTPLKIVAAILLIAALGATLYLSNRTILNEEQWITKNSQQEIFNLPLPEGTKVVLNKNSELKYPKEFKGEIRNVKLSGQAFFDVAHNPDKPFVIDYEEVSIKVLGTAFNLSDEKQKSTLEAKVIRGKVMMYDKKNSVVINAGWTGVYDKPTKTFSLRKSETENDLGYATHTFSFENTSINELTENLSGAFGVTFVFENEKIKDCRFTSTYHDKSLSFILDVVAESLNIRYSIKGKVVYISGDGCL